MFQRVMKIAAAPVAVLAFGLTAASGLSACEPSEPAKVVSGAGLPPWDPRARQIFDDNIDPASVGLSMEGPSPRSDAFLRERAQTADVVARIRVQTVTVDSAGEQHTYHLGIQV